jgi:hypothetical protein
MLTGSVTLARDWLKKRDSELPQHDTRVSPRVRLSGSLSVPVVVYHWHWHDLRLVGCAQGPVTMTHDDDRMITGR